ncbi:kinase-like domain-containing protein [Trametes polyzona]|nr:kinase-like domain-containing protein [Trametes polyzona]
MPYNALATDQATSLDGLFNYELHEEIARGATGVVYRATCRRGRLRNRAVAVKKISHISNAHIPRDFASAASLHSTLIHPSIVSLISAFNAPSDYYYVYEYYPHGHLADFLLFRNSLALPESELRGVAKPLIDALIYLRKELVLHRDISPANILISEHGNVKLSGFGAAVKLATAESTETAFHGSANYVSPEILSGRAYSFATDLWSVGCVLVTCVSGQPAFNAPHPDKVYDNICNVQYTLPDSTSPHVRDLIASILQKNPHDRLSLHRIPSHTFFKLRQPIVPLHLPAGHKPTPQASLSPTCENGIRKPSSPRRYPRHLSRDPSRSKPTVLSRSKPNLEVPAKRMPLGDITNLYLDESCSYTGDNLLRTPPIDAASVPMTARAAHPCPASQQRAHGSQTQTSALTCDSGVPGVSSGNTGPVLLTTKVEDVSQSIIGSEPLRHSPRSQLRRVLSDSADVFGSRRAVSLPAGRPRLLSRRTDGPTTHRALSQATSATVVSHPRSPKRVSVSQKAATARSSGVEDSNLFSLSTHRLKPQTHKVSRGQLVVLPSRALLVDFREGERRKGGKGREVIVVSADGHTIQVYDAPHLSTPCCLAEPAATYSLSELPQSYMKQYSDAGRLVDQLKSRIPKLVHYSDEAKCTLMSNGPPGDVEVLIPGDQDTKSTHQEVIRLRLQQKKLTLEISRYSGKSCSRKGLGEWTKKIIALGPDLELAVEDKIALDELERLAMRHLSEFLRICSVACASDHVAEP